MNSSQIRGKPFFMSRLNFKQQMIVLLIFEKGRKFILLLPTFNPYHQHDLWALVVYRTPGESTRYLHTWAHLQSSLDWFWFWLNIGIWIWTALYWKHYDSNFNHALACKLKSFRVSPRVSNNCAYVRLFSRSRKAIKNCASPFFWLIISKKCRQVLRGCRIQNFFQSQFVPLFYYFDFNVSCTCTLKQLLLKVQI